MLPSRGIARSAGSHDLRRALCYQSSSFARPARQAGNGYRHFGTTLHSGKASFARTTIALSAQSHGISRTAAIGGAAIGTRTFSLWPFGRSGTSKPASAVDAAPPSSPAVAPPAEAVTPAPVLAEPPVASTMPDTLTSAPAPSVSPTFEGVDLDVNALLNMEEHIGYLKTLGLDFGWGPSSVVQWVIEHIHVWGGAPWWASIVLTALLIRAALWKPTLLSLDQGAKVGIWKNRPEVAALQKQMIALSVSRAPTAEVMAVRSQIQRSQAEAGVKPMYAFLGLLHIPFGFGMWRVISNMARLPVPSMETGGLLWFTDLTVPDPLYILPIVGPVAMFTMLRLSNRYSPPSQQATLRLMVWVLGPLSIVFTAWLPAGVTFYFAVAALLGVAQNAITIQPWFRRWAGLPVLQPPAPNPHGYQPPKDASTFSVLKGQFQHIVKEAQSSQGGMTQRMQMRAEADKENKVRTQREEEIKDDMWKRIEKRKQR